MDESPSINHFKQTNKFAVLYSSEESFIS